ncbi:MAG: hypothetical protein WDN44_02995 [Sphingomonas sp.]
MTMFKKATLGLVLGATALTAVAAPADAQRYRRGYRGHDNAGAAIVAGVAGLAIGAALASGDHRYDYDRRYYRDHGYYPTDGYYYREHYRGGYDGCTVRRHWDPYLRRSVMVRYCR